jgi:putative DNA primase/helicase
MSTATAEPRDLTAFARVPSVLTDRPQWVLWRHELRDGKTTKIPYDAKTGRMAESDDPATWAPYATALEAYAASDLDGIGFVFAADDGLAGFDFDDCLDDAGNFVSETVAGYVARLGSYTEVSPSGHGVKVFLFGAVPGGKGRKRGDFEAYDRLRYFTVTGRHLPGTPRTVEHRADELLAVHAEVFPAAKAAPAERRAPQPSGDADDDRIIEKVTADPRWARLWNGDASAYGSASEADLALMGRIGFFCGWDAGRMESLFGQSGLTRDKWNDRADYRQWTVNKAREGKSGGYDWTRRNGGGDDFVGSALQHRGRNGHEHPDASAPTNGEQTDGGPGPAEAKLRTDIGNAARFVRVHGRDVRFCYKTGRWYVFDGRRWTEDDRGDVMRRAKGTALSIYREAAEEPDEAKRPAIVDHATKTQKRERLTAMLELAKPDLSILPDEFDADPNLFNCPNGTVDLRTGHLRPHRREDFITKLAGVDYDPTAHAPTFRRFMARIFRTYPNLIDWMQRVFGYAATGLTVEQIVVFLYGTGANGKTTLLDAVAHVLGNYSRKADRELLVHSDGAQHPTNIADLMGCRLAICSETNDGRRFDEAKLKDLVGEHRLKGRFMRQDFFEFTATHCLFLYSNHRLIVRGQDHGFWRRMREVPFIETISDSEKDPGLREKLQAEAAGILAWVVAGAVRWYAEGLDCPAEVTAATNAYRTEMDGIGTFIDEACVVGEKLSATSRDLYAAYSRWCDAAGERPLSQTRLGTELGNRGLIRDRDSYTGRILWRGIGLKSPDSVREDAM